MSRNLTFQPLRGVQANLQYAMPLALGEMYFCTDTNNLIFGTPGSGLGYIIIGDTSQVNERLDQLIVLMEATRRAMVALVCKEGIAKEQDFDPATISTELAAQSPVGR